MSALSDKIDVQFGFDTGAFLTSSVGGLTATNTNGVAQVDEAAEFDADLVNYLEVPDDPAISLTGPINYWSIVVELYAKVNNGHAFVSKDQTAVDMREYLIWYSTGMDRFGMQLHLPDLAYVELTLNTFGSPVLDTPYFLEFRTDGTKLYGCVNRGAEDEVAVAFTDRDTAAPLQFGALNGIGGYFHSGKIDNFLFAKDSFTTEERDFIANGNLGSNWARLLAGPTAEGGIQHYARRRLHGGLPIGVL